MSITLSFDISTCPRQCSRCDRTVEPDQLKMVYTELDSPITTGAELGLPPIEGFWSESCTDCILPDDIIKED